MLQVDESAVLAWLQHPDIFNLELTAIAARHDHEKIKTFLAESVLADHAAGAAAHGLRLRVGPAQKFDFRLGAENFRKFARCAPSLRAVRHWQV